MLRETLHVRQYFSYSSFTFWNNEAIVEFKTFQAFIISLKTVLLLLFVCATKKCRRNSAEDPSFFFIPQPLPERYFSTPIFRGEAGGRSASQQEDI